MDLLALATELLQKKLSGNIDKESISQALSGLLGINGGGLEVSGLVSSMMQNDSLKNLALSWLGDGVNQSISSTQISSLFGDSKLSKFASQLGVSQPEAEQSLAEVLPKIVDTSSSGGSLLDSVGGVGGLMGAARKLF